MSEQKPTPGRMVTAVGFRARSNGTDVCPAIITRVWGDAPLENGAWTVNVTLFRDNAPVQTATSVSLWPDAASARKTVEQGENVTALHWPERV